MEATSINNRKWYQNNLVITFLLILFFPVGLYLMWKYAGWNKIIKLVILGFFLLVIFVGFTGKPSEKYTQTNTQSDKPEQQSGIKIETAGKNEPQPTLTISIQPTLKTASEIPKNMAGTEKYPSLTDETMDRDFIFSCEGGDMVGLWERPAEGSFENRVRDKVQCGTSGWAFNKYYNQELKVTFYAVQTNDKNVKNTYGWVTEDLLTWR